MGLPGPRSDSEPAEPWGRGQEQQDPQEWEDIGFYPLGWIKAGASASICGCGGVDFAGASGEGQVVPWLLDPLCPRPAEAGGLW